MDQEELSKLVNESEDKKNSKFFMPDNFYDEKADIINDYETSKKQKPYVGDPALKPKDVNLNKENSDRDISTSFENKSDHDNLENLDVSKLFNPQFITTDDGSSSDNEPFSSNIINEEEQSLSIKQPLEEKEEASTSVTDFENTYEINKILNNVYGINYDTTEEEKHELYDDLRPLRSEKKEAKQVVLDSNFTIKTESPTENFDKTLTSNKEFAKLNLYNTKNNNDLVSDSVESDDNFEFSYRSKWDDIPKTTYKAGSVNIPSVDYKNTDSYDFKEQPVNLDEIEKDSNNIVNSNSLIAEDKNDTIKEKISVGQESLTSTKSDIQSWIDKILKVDNPQPVKITSSGSIIENNVDVSSEDIPSSKETEIRYVNDDDLRVDTAIGNIEKFTKKDVDYDFSVKDLPVHKSTLLDELKEKNDKENKISILVRYGDDFCSKDYVTNPAIGRSNEIRQLILILLTPEKSGILVGKPGIGKTSIVEGLAYQLQRDNVPDALKGYTIVNVKTASLLGTLPSGETRLQTLVDELKELDKVILFIDEIHMLIGSTNESALDFANMFKEGLGRGKIKVIGATTTEEYERYILRDKAFVRRFQKVEVEEPNREHTIRILLGTLPKIEKSTGAKLKYDSIVQGRIMGFIVDITSEYKRIYGIGSRYPDICLTLLSQAFSQAVFDDRKEVNIFDIRNAIENSKNIYPDVIKKELVNFDKMFENVIREEQGLPPLKDKF